MSPEVILRTKEEDGKLSDLVSEMLNVGRNVFGMVDLSGPPSERKEFN